MPAEDSELTISRFINAALAIRSAPSLTVSFDRMAPAMS